MISAPTLVCGLGYTIAAVLIVGQQPDLPAVLLACIGAMIVGYHCECCDRRERV